MASMSQLTMAMVTLYSGDPKRIQHFMKVYAFAKMIAEEEQLGAKQREILHHFPFLKGEAERILCPYIVIITHFSLYCNSGEGGFIAVQIL